MLLYYFPLSWTGGTNPIEAEGSLADQMAALRAHAADVRQRTDLMSVLAGTMDVLRESQQLAGQLQAQGAPSLSGEISRIGTVLQRVRSASPVVTAYQELTRDPAWRPPQPGAVTPAQERLVEQALMRFFLGPLAASSGGVQPLAAPGPLSSSSSQPPLALPALPSLPLLPAQTAAMPPLTGQQSSSDEPTSLMLRATAAVAALQGQGQRQQQDEAGAHVGLDTVAVKYRTSPTFDREDEARTGHDLPHVGAWKPNSDTDPHPHHITPAQHTHQSSLPRVQAASPPLQGAAPSKSGPVGARAAGRRASHLAADDLSGRGAAALLLLVES